MTRLLLLGLLLGLLSCKKDNGPAPSLFPGRSGPRVETLKASGPYQNYKKKYYYDEAGRVVAIQHYDYDEGFYNAIRYTLYKITYDGDTVDVETEFTQNSSHIYSEHLTIQLDEQGRMISGEYTFSDIWTNIPHKDIVNYAFKTGYGVHGKIASRQEIMHREVSYDGNLVNSSSRTTKTAFEWSGDKVPVQTIQIDDNQPHDVYITYWDQANTTAADFTRTEWDGLGDLFQEIGLIGDICTYIPRKVEWGNTTFEHTFEVDAKNRISKVTRVSIYKDTFSDSDYSYTNTWEFTYY